MELDAWTHNGNDNGGFVGGKYLILENNGVMQKNMICPKICSISVCKI